MPCKSVSNRQRHGSGERWQTQRGLGPLRMRLRLRSNKVKNTGVKIERQQTATSLLWICIASASASANAFRQLLKDTQLSPLHPQLNRNSIISRCTGKKRTKSSESHHPARAQEHSGEDMENPGKRKGKRASRKQGEWGRRTACAACRLGLWAIFQALGPVVWVRLNRPLETGRMP